MALEFPMVLILTILKLQLHADNQSSQCWSVTELSLNIFVNALLIFEPEDVGYCRLYETHCLNRIIIAISCTVSF